VLGLYRADGLLEEPRERPKANSTRHDHGSHRDPKRRAERV
jgi:hypothetical protein